jgi:putative DNA primase/helicase
VTKLDIAAAHLADCGQTFSPGDVEFQFRDEIRVSGLTPPESVIADGQMHRFSTNGKHGDDAGWYILHADGIPAGAFGCWRVGLSRTWRAPIGRELTAAEKTAHFARLESIRKLRVVEGAARKAEARAQANEIWNNASPASDDHPYLKRKSVKPHGLRVSGLSLIVPVHEGSELHSLQFIEHDGAKRFLPGGRVGGCYFIIGTPTDRLCVAEGYATAASIYEATGTSVAVAFNTNNLLPVARALRTQFPTIKLIICADDDAKTAGNPGLTKAREAAAAVGGHLAIPDFGPDRTPWAGTDFNDLHKSIGADAIKTCIAKAVLVAPDPPATATIATAATPWSEPQPLDRDAGEHRPYPLGALPGDIGAAVEEYHGYGQQPKALVASAALAAVSLAAQGLADVARDDRLRGPISLNFLTIAQSGERKTAADKAMSRALAEWEREKADGLRDAITRNKADIAVWAAQQEGYMAAMKKATIANKRDDIARLQEQMMQHAANQPTQLIAPRLRYEDVNPQSLPYMLAKGYPSAALWSDEGGMVTGSQGMGKDAFLGFLAVMNRLWDGGEVHQDRKQAESVHVEGRRLTASLMLQPSVLSDLLVRGGGLSRGSGFLARYLVSAPQSTMGQRPYKEPPNGMAALDRFNRRIRALLDMPLPVDEHGRLQPPLLRLSVDAFAVWRSYHDEIERELVPHGDYATACDFAAKSAENAARIAACLHIFEDSHGAIDSKTMQRAVLLARWYLRESLRLLQTLDEPQAVADARSLEGWLAQSGSSSLRDVQRLGPNPLRDRARRDAAVRVLAELGRARVERDGNRDMLTLNPALHSAKAS